MYEYARCNMKKTDLAVNTFGCVSEIMVSTPHVTRITLVIQIEWRFVIESLMEFYLRDVVCQILSLFFKDDSGSCE